MHIEHHTPYQGAARPRRFDEGSGAVIRYNAVTLRVAFDDYTRDNRCRYRWTIRIGARVWSEADLRSGVGQEPNGMEMLGTLVSFLTAAMEGGENADLFPADCLAAVSARIADPDYLSILFDDRGGE